jgi:hypothetical protein
VSRTVYQYVLDAPTDDLHAGDAIQLTWKATPRVVVGEPASEKVRLCVALIGPYPGVADLKSSGTPARTCPIAVTGTVLASEVAEADLSIGTPVEQPLTLPTSMAPGYYQLVSVIAYGSSDTGNSASAAGIVRVVPRP